MSQDYSLAAGGDFKDGRGRADVVLSYTDRASLGRKDRDFFRVSTVTGRFGRLIVNNASNPGSDQYGICKIWLRCWHRRSHDDP
ncbi:MAG: hypothetical protein WDN76_11785 [Alphaproteobacteria bacterium]